MLLIGQFDSPYVRRVGIALKLYKLAFEHRRYSVFRDAELIAPYNPLRKVPTLVLDDGTVLTESFVCLEVIDELVATSQPDAPLLLPRSGPLRREGLRVAGLCTGTCEKAVSLVYEREVRKQTDAQWVVRCKLQVRETVAYLERICASHREAFLLGPSISHADIAAACTLTFIEDALPGLLAELELPALRNLQARSEAMPEFASVKQAFDIPRKD